MALMRGMDPEVAEARIRVQPVCQCLLGGTMPARVHNPQLSEVEPEGQPTEPVDGVSVGFGAIAHLLQEFMMLGLVL